MKILLTGIAGFIGNTLAYRLGSRQEFEILGIDNLNDYYDVNLKQARLARLSEFSRIRFERIDLRDSEKLAEAFSSFRPDVVVHLAAQAGVRYSIDQPRVYQESNLTGFLNVLEGCRYHRVKHLVYASTSSVYGSSTAMPFKESDPCAHPLSFYAATKKANEVMAHSYSAVFGLPVTGLRFFTVYGPWGRPDMALFKFTKNILADHPIDVFNAGNHTRDFTYVDDIVEGVSRVMLKPATPSENWDSAAPDPSISNAPYRIFNIGNGNPVKLLDYIGAIETRLGKKAILNKLPLQVGDVPDTWADCSALEKWVGYRPSTTVQEGINRFIDWYQNYYRVSP